MSHEAVYVSEADVAIYPRQSELTSHFCDHTFVRGHTLPKISVSETAFPVF